MSTPHFDEDMQLSAWLESVDLVELDVADDVVISRNLTMHVEWAAPPAGSIGGNGTATVHSRNGGATTTAPGLLLPIPA